MTFPRVREQEKAKKILARMIESSRVPSSLVFAGPPGVGKALLAREFAKALICPQGGCGDCAACAAVSKGVHPDVKLVGAEYQASLRSEEAAKQRTLRVETIRHLRKDMELESMLGSWKAAIVEEAHALEPEAANALLKILEEPPPRTLWILVTPLPERCLKTVLSRCQRIAFSPLTERAVAGLLVERGIPPSRAEELSGLSSGSVSAALELEEHLDDIARLAEDPLAASEALPKELYLAREKAQALLTGLAWTLRRGNPDFLAVEKPLRELLRLRQALRANADPRLVLLLAGEAARND